MLKPRSFSTLLSLSSTPKRFFSTKLGWVGTGVMGSSMCSHLIKAGHKMTVYNRTLSKCDELAKMGATVVNSPKEVGNNSDIIFTIVGFPSDVKDTIIGENGILNGCKSSSIIVDMTTSEPSLAKELSIKCKSKNVELLDAPVSGGDIGAKNGTLSIMVGGNKDTYEECYPYLSLMGKEDSIRYLGLHGSGQHCKMVNQIVIANNMIGVCEGLIYGYKVGLDLSQLLSTIGGGAASSFSLNILGNRMIGGDFDPGFLIEHFIKDLGIALQESKNMNLYLPGLALANQLYISCCSLGYKMKGTQALILSLEKLSNSEYFKQLETNRVNNLKT